MKQLTARQNILKEFLDRVWSSGEIDQCDRFLADSYAIRHDPGDPWDGLTLDLAGFKERVRLSREPFPDQRFDVQEWFEADAQATASKLHAEAQAASEKVHREAEIEALRQTEQVAATYAAHPALLRLRELEALKELSQLANARIYIGFKKHDGAGEGDD